MENRVYVLCNDCQCIIEEGCEDDYYNPDGKPVCERCYEDNYCTCYECGDTNYLDDMTNIEDALICESCRDRLYGECAECGEYIRRDSTYFILQIDDFVCEHCFGNYSQCDNCGEYYHLDYLTYSEDDDQYYCDNCYSEAGNEIETIEPDFSDNTYNELNYQYTYGLELETSQKIQESFETVFKSTEDGSISGKEYVSKILRGDKGLEYIRDFCEKARDNGAEVNSSCGYHLHIGSKDFTTEQVRNIFWLYKYFEPLFYSMLPKSRGRTRENSGSAWCEPIDNIFSFKQIENCKTQKDVMKLYYAFSHDDLDSMITFAKSGKYASRTRYRSINLHSHYFRGTIEFRGHSGTLDSKKIINWIKLHMLIIDIAVNNDLNYLKRVFTHQTKHKIIKLHEALKNSVLSNEADDLIDYIQQRILKFNPEYVEIELTNKQLELVIA